EGRVLWLGKKDLVGSEALDADPSAPTYLSATLLETAAGSAGPHTMMTYPWEVPAAREPRVLRSRLWLRTHGLEPPDEAGQAVAVHTLFAINVAGEALAHLQDSFSRDYFVERVEHAITTTITPTFFPNVSLGPGQRFASKGAYVVRTEAGGGSVAAVSEWIVP
ncbi:MAG: c-type cytochrome, partial [Ramlibacter sp.]|nr:c-type cytochrome [Ramlibacter sp.]